MRFCCILTCLTLLLSACDGSPSSGSGSIGSASTTGGGSSADAALLGETFYLTIDDASSDLADYGSYKIRYFNGNYDAPGDGYFVADSGGTFTANIVGGKIIVKANDSELGIA